MARQNQNSHIHYYFEVEQNTPEWHELRATVEVTGSTAYDFLRTKNPATYKKKENNSFKGNKYTRRGHRLEPEGIELLKQIKRITVEHCGFVTNDKYPKAGYSPDGFGSNFTVEHKAFMPDHHLKAIKSPDLTTLAQCYFGQLILEKEFTYLIFYCPHKDVPVEKQLVIKIIKKNPKVEENFKKRLALLEGINNG